MPEHSQRYKKEFNYRPDSDANLTAYERHCRQFKLTPYTRVLQYARVNDERERQEMRRLIKVNLKG